jgi:hypothetical protein
MRKKVLTSLVLALLIVAGFSAGAWAEEKKDTLAEIKDALGLSIYLQGGYTYNFDDPDSRENAFRVFDHEAESFQLDLAQVVFAKAPEKGVGFKVKLSAGETAKLIHSAGLGEAGDEFDITEAFIDYTFDNSLKLRFGKYVTMHGAEVIEALDNMNYSRGFLFNYAIPFTHTGFMASYPVSEKFSLSAHLVNGWDNTEDNNDGKTVGLVVGVAPVDLLSMTFNLMYGPEQPDNDSDNRFLFDWVATVKPMDKLTLMVNTDYATEENAVDTNGDGIADDDAQWYGVAGYAKYDLSDMLSLAVRGEYFNDDDGVRTGTEQELKEITFTPEIRLKGLVIRPEYRHDWSDEDSFAGEDSQDTVALAFMYRW